MIKLIKYTSSLVIAVFAMLVIAEFAGVRVHHAESSELVGVFSCVTNEANEDRSDTQTSCPSDETPIEHVFHFSSSGFASNRTLLSFSFPVLFVLIGHSVVLPPVAKSLLVIDNQIVSSLLVSYLRPDRAPPVTL